MTTVHETEGTVTSLHCSCGATWTFKDGAIEYKSGKPQPKHEQGEPVAWRDHVEQRLLTWRQSFVNKSGDQLALDDFMDKQSLDDLLEYVLDEYTTPQQRTWVELTKEDIEKLWANSGNVIGYGGLTFENIRAVEAACKEKNT